MLSRSNSWDAMRVYLLFSGIVPFLFTMVFTVNLIYQVQTIGLNPLQLVLVGTVLEVTCFLFEVPTGVVADLYSRRLSIIIGLVLIGCGFMVEGGVARFEAVLLAQVLWGIGATFISGATEAWITDEVGEESAGKAFLRGAQIGSFAGVIGLGASMVLGSIHMQLPIVLGGLLFLAFAGLLVLIMPEHGFKPVPQEDRSTWRGMFSTFNQGVKLVRVRPILVTILLISVVFGMFSEGLDRLTTTHYLNSFVLPDFGGLQPVVWMGLMGAIGSLITMATNEVLRRRVDTTDSQAISRVLGVLYALLIICVMWFALAQSFMAAVVAGWMVGVLRSGMGPLESAWTNLHTESDVRATVLSIRSQMNALGQIAGGPVVGYIALNISVRIAMTISALLLTPALWLFARSRKNDIIAEPAGQPAA